MSLHCRHEPPQLIKRTCFYERVLDFLLHNRVGYKLRPMPGGTGASGLATKFKILALAESGGHHIEFTRAAKPWLKKCGDANGFEVDYITNTAAITEAFLAGYRLVLQIGFCSLRVEA